MTVSDASGEHALTEGGALCEEIIYTGDWPVCGDVLTNRSGLVYGFGIEMNWDFEAAAGALGFEVRVARPASASPPAFIGVLSHKPAHSTDGVTTRPESKATRLAESGEVVLMGRRGVCVGRCTRSTRRRRTRPS